MTDTTTKLSLGTQDGDVMDESLVTQPGDGVTQAKRPRVHQSHPMRPRARTGAR